VSIPTTYYQDMDLDGYGNASVTQLACSTPTGYTTNSTDCNDQQGLIHPGATEVCTNGLDDNCNGQIDENCVVNGCTDSQACNYNAAANNNDGSCTYPEQYYDCNGNCLHDTDNDGVCNEFEIMGCNDPTACNFNPIATDNDGSCLLPQQELCNGIDDNCNGEIDEGLTLSSITFTTVNTASYPTCTTGNLYTANLNNGVNTSVIQGDGPDLWYKLVPQYNALRVSLSAATGDNSLAIFKVINGCMQMIAYEHEATTGNQILMVDDLIPNDTYYIAVHRISGTSNASTKVCFNHFVATTCDHVYSSNTGVYANVCTSFKAVFKANASSYTFNVLSATQNGTPLAWTPYSYTTPTSSSIVTRLGSLVPANFTGTPIVYTIGIPVNYTLADAAGNMMTITADATTTCGFTLNSETTIQMRTADRCPAVKAITSYIAPDRTVCGASRYEWEFTQTAPTPATAVTVQGPLNSTQVFLNTVPGMANAKTYQVRVRPIHPSGAVGEWGASQCMKTTGAAMQFAPDDNLSLSSMQRKNGITVYPNPTNGPELQMSFDHAVNTDIHVVITNIMGERVYMNRFTEVQDKLILPTAEFSSGVYVIQVEADGRTESIRWIVEK
jgi:hypothetical protein